MKVIIAGGREVPKDLADDLVRRAIAESGWADQITEVIQGGASGIDAAAFRVCFCSVLVTEVPADWKKHGRSAGPIRNRKMAEMADALIAVWDGKSRGTKNMIETARSLGKPVFVYEY